MNYPDRPLLAAVCKHNNTQYDFAWDAFRCVECGTMTCPAENLLVSQAAATVTP